VADVTLTIDNIPVTVPAGTTIFDAARMSGIPIPTLCHQQNETPVGVCRVCVVQVEKARVLQAACIRPAENGMVVHTNAPEVQSSRRTLIELLMADHPKGGCARHLRDHDCELEVMAAKEGIATPRFPPRLSQRGQDMTSPAIAVDHEACILCDRCIRGCDEIRHNDVLGRRGKGFFAGIAFDHGLPMGNSHCVTCGECMVSCPTGALTNKGVLKQNVFEKGEEVTVDELQNSDAYRDYFHNVSGTFLELNRKAVVRRRFRAGEIVCREGEYGSTAFLIESGKAHVFLQSPMAHVKSEGGADGFFKKVVSKLAGRQQHRREEEHDRQTIPIDASVDLPYSNPVAELGPGDLFGEMTCMSLYPRSATVRAATDCVMLEMLRNVLDIIQRNKNMKARLDANYKKRALQDHLKSVPIFSTLTPEFIDELRERVELVRYQVGDVICRQGDVADAFFLVRIGFIKVSAKYPGGDFVQAYLGRGGYFGEIGLLGGEGRRTSTCTAIDHVEVVRIEADDFKKMIERFPAVENELKRIAQERLDQNRQRLEQAASMPITDFLKQGLLEAQSLLVLDLQKCTRCDQCVRACADAHDGVTRLASINTWWRHRAGIVAIPCAWWAARWEPSGGAPRSK